VAALLAAALYGEGRYEEAESFTHVSESAARRDDVWPQVIYRGTRAKLMARRGDPEAEALAREAVALADRTDVLDLRADALMDLAEVLGADGRSNLAAVEIQAALELYERKGNAVAAERARARLDSAVTA
jgi:hypothetical protein